MNDDRSPSYSFGEFRVDPGKRLLSRSGEPVPLTPKVFDTLLLLITHAGKVLQKQQVMCAVWPDTSVEENNLTQNISALRRALGENPGENRYIATIPGKGYCFTAEVRTVFTPEAECLPGQLRIAVLPFDNLGGSPAPEYLADGLTEETIAALGQIEPDHFSVIGRTSVMMYKHTTKSLATIGDELDAAYLIESSLRTEGDRVRITSKLIRSRDQIQIWSASYDSEPSSFLVFQRELGTVIAEQVRLRLSPARLKALASRQTQNAEAYDHYLHGRYYWNQFTAPTTQRAVGYFTRATELDPDYALAWSGLADAFSSSPITGDTPPTAVLPRARQAAEQAFRADPELAEALASLGFFRFWLGWDWAGAEDAHRLAIERDANYAFAHRMLGIVLSHCCRHEEATAAIRRARELDPLSAMNRALSSQIAFAAGDFPGAIHFAREAIVLDPEFWIGHMQLGQVLVHLQDQQEALAALNRASRASSGNSKAISLRGYLLAQMGQTAEANNVLAMLQDIARERYVPPYAMAIVHAGLDHLEQAMEWLDRSLVAHDVHLAFLTIDPKWDALRSDPRFVSVLQRCSFAKDVRVATAGTG